jgi:hypothetical protein
MPRFISKYKVPILLTLVLLISGIAYTYFYIPLNKLPANSIKSETTETVKLSNRALIIVFENNRLSDGYPTETTGYNSMIYRIALKRLFSLTADQTKGKSPAQIIDTYAEDWALDNFAEATNNYNEIVKITDEKTTITHFSNEIERLNNLGYTVDLVITVHGFNGELEFNDGVLTSDVIANLNDSNKYNLGFVYQGACDGSDLNQAWIDKGAKVVNGSAATNSYAIWGPEEFLKQLSNGVAYNKAVEAGYDKGVSTWDSLRGEDKTRDTDSKQVIQGDEYYLPYNKN